MIKLLIAALAVFVMAFAVTTVVRGQTTYPTMTQTENPSGTPMPTVTVPGGAPATGFGPN